MELFEKNYRAAAKEELERRVRELEEKDKRAETKTDIKKDTNDVLSNISFAKNIDLITIIEAQKFKERLQRLNFRRLERNETRDIVDDIENPRERSARYQSMDSYNAEIAREREKANKNGENSSSVNSLEDERER